MTRGAWGRGALLWALLLLSTMVCLMAVEAAGRRCFHEAWERLDAMPHRERARRGYGWGSRLLRWLPPPARAVVTKDVVLFLRDPVQWSQAVIFFGILAVYFLNLRNLQYHLLPARWQNLIVFLNVFSVCAVMCSFGSRFIYPQLSLDGQSFWMLGRSPMSMGQILMTKFWTSAVSMVAVSTALMYVSVSMLAVSPQVCGAALALAVVMSLAISGLSTGLGAVYLNLRHQNPAAILSSFGATLNLVLCLVVMFVAITPVGVVVHSAETGTLPTGRYTTALLTALGWAALVSLLAGSIPLLIGRRSLVRRDY
jgi:ABC-2 type transport system permease protein